MVRDAGRGRAWRLMAAATIGALTLSACSVDEEPQVLGVQLESPTPEAPESTPVATDAPADPATATEVPTEPAASPTATEATEAPVTPEPTETPTTEASEPATQPPAARPQPTRTPEPEPEVLGVRQAERRTEWSTSDDGGTRRWIETSSRQVSREDVAVLGVGLAPTGAADDAATRQAACTFELTAPKARRVVMQGELVMDLYVDGALRKRATIITDIILEKDTTYALPADRRPAPIEVSLAEVSAVSCSGSFTPSP